ncbi:MAG TPA: hypothetical protein VIA98_11205 [Allosphingosinicella sp.]|jgi:hypothetical protein
MILPYARIDGLAARADALTEVAAAHFDLTEPGHEMGGNGDP